MISLLAADRVLVVRRSASSQIAVAVAVGIALAGVGMQFSLGVRADLGQAIWGSMFWIKVLFPTAVTVASFATLARLARPGADARMGKIAIAVPILLLWLAAGLAYATAPPQERAALVWGQTWQMCTLNIVLISVPIFAAVLWALRQLAPTRLAQAGACVGALSGAAGAAIYAFHCPETALPFMALWYVAGIAVPASFGAWLGPSTLRW